MELREGYDVKLRGRVRRYRLVRIGAFPEHDVAEDEMIVQPHHPTRMRPHGRQIKVKLREVEAVCTGKALDGGPVWSAVEGPPSNPYPKMPRSWWVRVTGEHFTNDGEAWRDGGWRAEVDAQA